MENDIRITSVYAEMTPNPSTMKFVADRPIVQIDGIAEYASAEEAKGSSLLAEQLFKFPFVKGVFITTNFVTITKTDAISWDFITMELREFVMDFLRKNLFAVDKFPEPKTGEGEVKKFKMLGKASHTQPTSEIDSKIISVLDEFVRPAVENDGGAIHFQSFKEGIVSLVLRGSCSGCPSSMGTLKHGVEQLLKQMVPEVVEVVAVED